MADDHREELPAPDFRRLFEGAPDRYMVLSPSLHAIAFSDAYCRATMIERDKVLGRHLFDIFPDNPDDPGATGVANLRASLMRVLQFRKPDTMAIQKYDVRRKESDGGGFEMRYWAPLNTPIFNPAGDIICILHRADDVTETIRLQEKQTEREELARRQLHLIEELQSTKRFLDAVVDNVPGMLFVKSYPDCRFVLFNKGAENLLGYPAESFIGRTDHDFFPKEEADHFIANDRAVLETGTTLRGSAR